MRRWRNSIRVGLKSCGQEKATSRRLESATLTDRGDSVFLDWARPFASHDVVLKFVGLRIQPVRYFDERGNGFRLYQLTGEAPGEFSSYSEERHRLHRVRNVRFPPKTVASSGRACNRVSRFALVSLLVAYHARTLKPARAALLQPVEGVARFLSNALCAL
jgi:hypothetical protein